jgi:hypothetical protein
MMEKISVSKLMATHTQLRRGRRPYRVSTLLNRENRHELARESLKEVPEMIDHEPEKKSSVAVSELQKRAVSTELLTRARDAAIAKARNKARELGYKGMKGSAVDYFKRVAPKATSQAETFASAISRKKQEAAKALREIEPGLRKQMKAEDSALRQFELGKAAMLAGFFDEFNKMAAGGGAAMGAELLGAPGAAIGGYHEGGARGAIGGGGGALAGLAGGLGVRHLIKRHITGGQWGARHPLASTILEAAPLALGSTIGGAVGQHLLSKHGAMGMDLRHLTKSGVTKIHMPTEGSLAQAQQKLERSQRVGSDLKIKPPDPNIRAVATKPK